MIKAKKKQQPKNMVYGAARTATREEAGECLDISCEWLKMYAPHRCEHRSEVITSIMYALS